MSVVSDLVRNASKLIDFFQHTVPSNPMKTSHWYGLHGAYCRKYGALSKDAFRLYIDTSGLATRVQDTVRSFVEQYTVHAEGYSMALRTLFRLFAARVPDTRITVQQFNKCLVDLGLEVVREYSRDDQMVLNVVRNIRVARL